LVATVRAWEREGFVAARAEYAPWLPLVLCEAQANVSLAIRKEILRRRGALAEAGVRPPGAGLPPALHQALDAHLAAMPLPAWEAG
jgi:4-hydroxy-tetrahydrodipicolinate synthase